MENQQSPTFSINSLSTAREQPEILSRYVEATRLCDYDHPTIQDTLSLILRDCRNERERSLKIYYHVRDHVKFALMGSGFEVKASKTAAAGYGDCGTKTNVHIALLRGAGIPARMHAARADIRVLKGMIPPLLYLMVAPAREDHHFWPECFLDGKWTACEAFLDQGLYKAALRQGLLSREEVPDIDWDGKSQQILLKPWLRKDLGVLPSWDEWLVEYRKAMGFPPFLESWMEALVQKPCRRTTDRLRQSA